MSFYIRQSDEFRRRCRVRADYARWLASRLDKRALLRRAWTLARAGVVRFGGRVGAYIADALKQAWAETKARRTVAVAMAEDRRAMEGSFFQLTVPGVLALREAGG